MDTIKRFRSHLERSSRKSLNCKEHLIYLHGQILTSFPTKREDRLGNTGPRSWEYRPSAVRSVPKRLATTAKQLVNRVLQWKCQLHLQPLISFIIVFHNISSVISQEIIPILYVKDERTILLTTFTIEIFSVDKDWDSCKPLSSHRRPPLHYVWWKVCYLESFNYFTCNRLYIWS